MLHRARIVSGADFFLDLLRFNAAASETDLVITGEGKRDEQTLSGKLPVAVARRVPVVAVVGHNALGRDDTAGAWDRARLGTERHDGARHLARS